MKLFVKLFNFWDEKGAKFLALTKKSILNIKFVIKTIKKFSIQKFGSKGGLIHGGSMYPYPKKCGSDHDPYIYQFIKKIHSGTGIDGLIRQHYHKWKSED